MTLPESAEIRELAKRVRGRDLTILAGGGIALATSDRAKSWKDTLSAGLDFVLDRKLRSHGWVGDERAELDTDSVPLLVEKAKRLRAVLTSKGDIQPWADWLRDTFGSLDPDHPELVSAMIDLDLPIFTTNFDDLIEKTAATQGRRLKSISWDDFTAVARLNPTSLRQCVVHLHGHWSKPGSIIFDVESYDRVSGHGFASVAQKFMSCRGLLYIGCGGTLSDPNLSGLRRWHSEFGPAADGAYFRLSNAMEAAEIGKPEFNDGIKTVVYGNDYTDLPGFLREIVPPKPKRSRSTIAGSSTALRAYLDHCVRQWGVLDVPVPPTTGILRRDPIEQLYVRRTFVSEATASPKTGSDTRFQTRQTPALLAHTTGPSTSISDEMADSSAVLVIADAGMGKTALSRRIAWVYARRLAGGSGLPPQSVESDLPARKWIPLLIPGALLREVDTTQGIRGFVNAALRAPGFESAWADYICAALTDPATDGGLLVVDGLDEVAPRALRDRLSEVLDSLASENFRGLIIVTSRREGVEGQIRKLSGKFKRLRLEPLDRPQTELFLEAYLGKGSDSLSKEKRRRVDLAITDPRLIDVAGTPLGLAMLCQRSFHLATPTSGMTSLLRWLVIELIERGGTRLSPRLEARDVVPIFQLLALRAIRDEDPLAIPQSRLEQLIESLADQTPLRRGRDSRSFLRAVVESTNLLVKRGIIDAAGVDEPLYGFLFKSVGEYFAGGGLVRESLTASSEINSFVHQVEVSPVVDVAVEKRFKPEHESAFETQWLGVLAFAPAQMRVDAAEAAITSLLEQTGSDDGRTRRARVLLAARCLSELSEPSLLLCRRVVDACLISAKECDAEAKTMLRDSVQSILQADSFSASIDCLAEIVASTTSGLRQRCADNWLFDLIEGEFSRGDIDALYEDQGVRATLDSILRGGTTLPVTQLFRLIQGGFKSNVVPLAGYSRETAKYVFDCLLANSRAGGGMARLFAWALAWLAKAPHLPDPRWPVTSRQRQNLEDALLDKSLAGPALGYLSLVYSKINCRRDDPYKQLHSWARVADFDLPKRLRKEELQPSPKVARVAKRLRAELDSRGGGRVPIYAISLALARMKWLDAGVAKGLARGLVEPPPPQDEREAIMHLGRAGTLWAEKALLHVYRHAPDQYTQTDAFLALIGNGSRESLQQLRKIRSVRQDTLHDDTLNAFLVT